MWWQTYLNVLINLCFENLFWYKIDMFHNSCIISLLFIIVPVLESSPFFVLVSFRIIATSPKYVLWKMWIRVLWIIHFGVYFSSEAVLQSLSKNDPTESKSMPKFKWHGNIHQLENVQTRKCFRGYRNKLQNPINN